MIGQKESKGLLLENALEQRRGFPASDDTQTWDKTTHDRAAKHRTLERAVITDGFASPINS
jgi:hypothetical protein